MTAKRNDGTKVKVTYSRCQIYVQGGEMDCPLCGGRVSDGKVHLCGKDEPNRADKPIPKRKLQ